MDDKPEQVQLDEEMPQLTKEGTPTSNVTDEPLEKPVLNEAVIEPSVLEPPREPSAEKINGEDGSAAEAASINKVKPLERRFCSDDSGDSSDESRPPRSDHSRSPSPHHSSVSEWIY